MRTERKKFEYRADKCRQINKGHLQLAGIDVFLNESEVLYERDTFTQEQMLDEFEIKCGEWYVEDGWVVGKNPNCCPGMLVSKADFFGNNMLEVTVKMVAPSTHDINIMINGSWDLEKDQRDIAYVTGIEAFWHGNVGFEKSPEYKLTAATQLLEFDPEKEYKMQFGNIDGKIFVSVDGKLCLEITDPDPIDTSKYGKIGFEAYSSWWKFKDVKVKKLKYEKITEKYVPEF